MKRIALLAIAAVYICLPLLLKPSVADARIGDRIRARRAARAATVVEALPTFVAPTPVPPTAKEEKVKRVPTFSFYKDKAGEWRWRCKAANGKIVADSGEGYKNLKEAEHGLDLVRGDALIVPPQLPRR